MNNINLMPAFLSDEWFDAVERIRLESDAGQPPAESGAKDDLVLNLVVTGSPEGDRRAHLTRGAMHRGLAEDAPTQITLPFDVARQIFIDGDPQAATVAFVSGQIVVEGDMTKLMAMSSPGGPSPAQQAWQQRLRELTT